jgi:hypothetical protein
MAEKLVMKSVILFKLEDTYGVDITPTATDLVLCSVPTFGITGDKKNRNYIRNSLSSAGFSVGAKRQTISFSSELKGPNTPLAPDTPSYLDPILRAAGMIVADGVIGADDCLVYTPTSDMSLMKSATIYYWTDGIKHAMVGCRCTKASLNFSVDGHPSIDFEFAGLYAAPSDTSNPTIDISTLEYMPPSCLSIGMTIDSYTPVGVESITLDLGIATSEKKDMQSAGGLSAILNSGERTPSLSFGIDVPALASFNPYTLWSAGTKSAVAWTIGSKGNRVQISCPTVQWNEPKESNKDGRMIYDLSGLPTGSDDEYSIKIG